MVHFRVRDIKEKLKEFNCNVADDKKLDFYHFINRSFLHPKESVRHNIIVGNNIRIVTFDVSSYYYWELEISFRHTHQKQRWHTCLLFPRQPL